MIASLKKIEADLGPFRGTPYGTPNLFAKKSGKREKRPINPWLESFYARTTCFVNESGALRTFIGLPTFIANIMLGLTVTSLEGAV